MRQGAVKNLFPMRLKGLLREREITRKQLAHELQVSYSTICAYARGGNQPSIEMLIQMARFFHVSIDHLVGNGE